MNGLNEWITIEWVNEWHEWLAIVVDNLCSYYKGRLVWMSINYWVYVPINNRNTNVSILSIY